MIDETIGVAEFRARRERVLRALKGSAAIVFAGEGSSHVADSWQADWNFRYLTGIADEQGAAVFFDPRSEDPKRRAILFLRPLNPEVEQWDGIRPKIGANLKKRTGFETILRTGSIPMVLTTAARKRKSLACLHSFAVYDRPVSPDLAVFRKVAERVVGVSIRDETGLLAGMRSVKSARELRVMRDAIRATSAGFEAAAKSISPGVSEGTVQLALEEAFKTAGASGTGYGTIVGSGFNATVLHYRANNAVCAAGDLLVIDAGARVGGYTADITRTFPVSGKFTREQRELYELVERAMRAAIASVRPGVKMSDVDAAARAVIDKAGFADAFMHGIGHQLGMEVHDVQPDGPLAPGMVVTIEPGVYFPERSLGIRIEDDILVTRRGARNLSAEIPRGAKEIEAMMRGR